MMRGWNDRVLVIAPHADDETLGCGGLLAQLRGHARVLVMSLGMEIALEQPTQSREELMAALRALGVSSWTLGFIGDQNRLDQRAQHHLVSRIDAELEEYRPTAVFFPYASHHQDHRAVYDATLAALRPRELTVGINLVALYEYPYAADWPPPHLPGGKLHHALTPRDLEKKLAALRCYGSRFHDRAWVSVDRVQQWAEMRGREVGVEAAEAFWAIRGWL